MTTQQKMLDLMSIGILSFDKTLNKDSKPLHERQNTCNVTFYPYDKTKNVK